MELKEGDIEYVKGLIDIEAILTRKKEWYASGQGELFELAFNKLIHIETVGGGDYSGVFGFAFKLPDKRILLFTDYYGSCSGCDGLDGADAKFALEYVVGHVSSSMVLCESKKEAIIYLQKHSECEWSDIKAEMIIALK